MEMTQEYRDTIVKIVTDFVSKATDATILQEREISNNTKEIGSSWLVVAMKIDAPPVDYPHERTISFNSAKVVFDLIRS